MVISCGRLGGRWFDSSGRFLFCFLANVLFLGAQRAAVARDFGGVEKATDGHLTGGSGEVPKHSKPRSWREKPPVLRVHQRHSGAFFWAYGQIQAAARDVN